MAYKIRRNGMRIMKKLSEKSFTNNEIEVQQQVAPLFFAMRRKSCIFAAKYAENNNCIIRTKTMEYVYMGT